MRVALLTEGGYPYARGESGSWCERLLRGLADHEFEICALSRTARQHAGPRSALPPNVTLVRTAPLWGPPPAEHRGDGRVPRRLGRRYAEAFAELTAALCGSPHPARTPAPPATGGAESGTPVGGAAAAGPADRFGAGLYALAELAAEHGGLSGWLRSEGALRVLEAACRAPGAPRAVRSARVTDLLAVVERLERVLRPVSLDWYGATGARAAGRGLADVALCHAVGGGAAALPGLLARHFHGTPLLVTEHGARLREHYLISAAHAVAPSAPSAPVRALLSAFQARLAHEAYASAALITPGNTHTRRWQERCGADRGRLRTIYPGMDARPFHEVARESARVAVPVGAAGAAAPGRTPRPERDLPPGGAPRPVGGRATAPTLVWVGAVEPGKDLVGLLHAFAEVRRSVPDARLRLVATPQRGRTDPEYLAHCRALAAQLFPDEAPDRHAVGENPVRFEEVGEPAVPTVADAYAAASVAVLSSVTEGFPVQLVESMFCARATVSTDVGAVCEAIGGTGLVVPPRNPRALADACLDLLADPARRERLGGAARARALELFTVEQSLAAFRSIYLELISDSPARWSGPVPAGTGVPFSRPAEAHLPARLPTAVPSWADTAIAGGDRRPRHAPRAVADADGNADTPGAPAIRRGPGTSTTSTSATPPPLPAPVPAVAAAATAATVASAAAVGALAGGTGTGPRPPAPGVPRTDRAHPDQCRSCGPTSHRA
ncbi:DUF3492 domain-containing protein, partial [Streptomyces lonarensis]|uniref:DUF3492 domain-containing protein n=2 Tax=Streptomyces lonarensis TaxID=700599 RepID=UPI0028A60AE7